MELLRMTDLVRHELNHLTQEGKTLLVTLQRVPEVAGSDHAACTGFLNAQIEENGRISNLAVLDAQGNVLCSANKAEVGLALGDRKYFQRAVASRDFAVGDFIISRITGRPVLVLALPVVENGSVTRVLTAALDLEWLFTLLGDLQLPPGLAFIILDPHGAVLARFEESGRIPLSEVTDTRLVNTVLNQRNGSYRGVGLDGVDRLNAFTDFSDSGQPSPGFVVIGVPQQYIDSLATAAIRQSMTGLGIVALLALAAALWGGQVLVLRPAHDLLHVTCALAEGDLSVRAGEHTGLAELDRLAGAMNEMADTIQQRVRENEKIVAALRESESKFRSLAESTNAAIFIYQGENFVYVNRAAEELTGYPREELLRTRFWDVVHPDDREMVRERGLARQRGEPVASRYELRLVRKDGAVRDLDFTAVMIDFGGQPAGLGTSVDITERKAAEKRLRESEESFRLLFTNNPLPMWVYDLETLAFLQVNDAAVNRYGYSREEFISMRLPDIRPAEDVQLLLDDIAQDRPALQNSFPWRHRLKDGRIILVQITSHTLEFGGRKAALVVAEDITSRIQAEAALNRRVDELTALHEVAQAAAGAESIDKLLQITTSVVGQLLSTHDFGIMILDEAAGLLRAHPSYHTGSGRPSADIPVDTGIVGWVARNAQPLRIDNVSESDLYYAFDDETRSELCVPIRIGARVFGVLNTESRQMNAFSKEDERVLQVLAGELGTAIARLQLLEAERARRMEAEHLRDASAELVSTLDLEQVIDRILTHLERVVPFDSALIVLTDRPTAHISAQRAVNQGGLTPFLQRMDQLEHIREVLSGKLVIIPDTHKDPRWDMYAGSEYIRCWLGVPLVVRDRVIGLMMLDHSSPHVYTSEHANLVVGFANQAAVAIRNATLFQELEASNRELQEAYERTIEGWSHALDLRDHETEGHTQRVTEMTLRLASELGVAEEEMVHIRRGALLHDIGKMGIPDHILFKPGPLTPAEWETMRLHPRFAYEMLSPIRFLAGSLDIPYCHHEHWDGTGYPRGLKGEQIPLAARIFSVVDVWDALRSDRPYRPAWSEPAVLNYLRERRGTQFDPRVLDAFIKMLQRMPAADR